MKKLVTVLVLLVAINSQAQDFVNLLKDFLPKEVKIGNNISSYNAQFLRDGKISPDLIYLRVLYLNKTLNEQITNTKENYFDNIWDIIQTKRLEHNSWIDDQTSKWQNKYGIPKIDENGIAFFKGKKKEYKTVKYSPKQIENYNKNLDYYCRYIYYAGSKAYPYDSTVNYETEYQVVLTKIKENLVKKIKSIPTGNNTIDLGILDEFMENRNILNSNAIDIVDYINSKGEYVYGNENNVKFAVTLGGKYYWKESKMTIKTGDLSDFIEKSGAKQDKDLFEVSNDFNFSLGAQYHFKTYDNNGIGSFINIGFNFTVGYFNNKYVNKDTAFFKIKAQYVDSLIMREYYLADHKLSSAPNFGLSLNLSTPILFILDNVYLGFGLHADCELISYNIKFNTNYIRHSVWGYRRYKIPDENFSDDFLNVKFLISPLVLLNADLSKNLRLSFNCGIYGAAASLGYEF